MTEIIFDWSGSEFNYCIQILLPHSQRITDVWTNARARHVVGHEYDVVLGTSASNGLMWV